MIGATESASATIHSGRGLRVADPKPPVSERHIRGARRWGFAIIVLALLVLAAKTFSRLSREIAAPRHTVEGVNAHP
jgi:hypothetical protein